jgi:hypothetical protein
VGKLIFETSQTRQILKKFDEESQGLDSMLVALVVGAKPIHIESNLCLYLALPPCLLSLMKRKLFSNLFEIFSLDR